MRLGFLAKGPWSSRLSWDTSLPWKRNNEGGEGEGGAGTPGSDWTGQVCVAAASSETV